MNFSNFWNSNLLSTSANNSDSYLSSIRENAKKLLGTEQDNQNQLKDSTEPD